MARLEWDKTAEHFYETGVDYGVLYVYDSTTSKYLPGVVWNGLTGVTESPSGAEANAFWADNIKYLNIFSAEDFGATIEAYTYPDAFMECDGSAIMQTGVVIGQQPRKTFAFCYRTKVGNDVSSSDLGYKIHIVYGAMASPSERGYTTINDSPEAITFSWEISTTPIEAAYGGVTYNKTAHLEIDSTKFPAGQNGTENAKLALIENWLWGKDNSQGQTDGNAAILLMPAEIAEIAATGTLASNPANLPST